MENKFWNLLTAFIDLIIGTLGGIVLNVIISRNIGKIERFVLILVLCVIVFVLYAINALFLSKVYDSCSFIRKWFMPQCYIEGIWVQVIDDNTLDKVPPTKYSILNIKMQNSQIVIEGHSYNQGNNGEQMTSFKIPYATFINEIDTLEYHYDFITREFRKLPNYIGKACLKFERRMGERYFSRYNGTIISNLPRAKKEILVRAFKSTKKIKLPNGNRVKIDETTIKQSEVQNYIDNCIKEIF